MKTQSNQNGDDVIALLAGHFGQFAIELGFTEFGCHQTEDTDGGNIHQKHDKRHEGVVHLINHARYREDLVPHCSEHGRKYDAEYN